MNSTESTQKILRYFNCLKRIFFGKTRGSKLEFDSNRYQRFQDKWRNFLFSKAWPLIILRWPSTVILLLKWPLIRLKNCLKYMIWRQISQNRNYLSRKAKLNRRVNIYEFLNLFTYFFSILEFLIHQPRTWLSILSTSI